MPINTRRNTKKDKTRDTALSVQRYIDKYMSQLKKQNKELDDRQTCELIITTKRDTYLQRTESEKNEEKQPPYKALIQT